MNFLTPIELQPLYGCLSLCILLVIVVLNFIFNYKKYVIDYVRQEMQAEIAKSRASQKEDSSIVLFDTVDAKAEIPTKRPDEESRYPDEFTGNHIPISELLSNFKDRKN